MNDTNADVNYSKIPWLSVILTIVWVLTIILTGGILFPWWVFVIVYPLEILFYCVMFILIFGILNNM